MIGGRVTKFQKIHILNVKSSEVCFSSLFPFKKNGSSVFLKGEKQPLKSSSSFQEGFALHSKKIQPKKTEEWGHDAFDAATQLAGCVLLQQGGSFFKGFCKEAMLNGNHVCVWCFGWVMNFCWTVEKSWDGNFEHQFFLGEKKDFVIWLIGEFWWGNSWDKR